MTLNKIKKFFKLLLAKIPSRLPIGATEFKEWSDSIISLYDLPDNDSVRFSLAVSIMHVPPTSFKMPKEYFGMTMLKAAANEVAHHTAQALKTKQQEEAKKQAEDTATKAEPSDGSKTA